MMFGIKSAENGRDRFRIPLLVAEEGSKIVAVNGIDDYLHNAFNYFLLHKLSQLYLLAIVWMLRKW